MKNSVNVGVRVALFAAVVASSLCVSAAPAKKEAAQKESPAKKSVLVLGDSISDKRHIGCQKNYWGFLADRYGFTPYVCAVNGHQMINIPIQAGNFAYANPKVKPDVVIIFAGSNDYNANVPLGEWYTFTNEVVNVDGSMVERKRRKFVFDDKTFRGRVNRAVSVVRDLYPEAWIVLMTPIHRGYATFGRTNVQQDETYANKLGLFLDSYVDVIKEAGNVWAVKVVDLHSVSGIYPNSKKQDAWIHDVKNDRLHPSTEGHRRIAEAMAREIGAYFE